jgi:hypothetical protein
LRRYFKSVGTELGIDPTIMNLLVGHTVKGVDRHFIARLRLSVLRHAAQRIADEIENPQLHDEEEEEVQTQVTRASANVERFDAYLRADDWPSLATLAPNRHVHYLRREDLHRLV